MLSRFERALGSRTAVAVAVAVCLAIASTSIAIGFLTDDHAFRAELRSSDPRAPAVYDLFRFVPGSAAGNELRLRYGRLPWWAAPDLKIQFLRPLTSLAFAADDRLFDDDPLGYHLTSLAWYLGLLVAAAALFRRLLAPAAATLAVAVYGLSAAHVEAYAWLSARHAVIAGALAAASLAAQCTRRGRWLGPLALAVALTASEAALAVVPLSIALAFATSPRPWRSGWRAAVPAAVLGVAYLTVYAALGYGTRGSGGYHDPASDPLGFAALAAVRVPLLLGDAALGIPAELAHVVAEWKLAVLGAAASGVVALAWRWTAPARGVAAESSGAARTVDSCGAIVAETSPAVGDSSPVASVAPSGLGRPATLAWLVAGGVGATVLGAAGFPGGRMLVVPDLAFAAVLGGVLHRGLAARWSGRLLAALLAVVHLAIAPLATLRTVHRLVRRAHETGAIAHQIAALAPPSGRVFLVAASDPMVFLYPRSILADIAPGTLRCWSVLSAARAGHRITRLDRHTLALEPVGRSLLDGSFDTLFRSSDQPFSVGDSVEQCGATIRVTAIEAGRPSRIEVRMRRSLDDPELGWVIWREHQLVRFALPEVGQTVDVAWSPGPSGVF